MLLTPRYEGPPLLRFAAPAGDPSVPLLRQRRRLVDRLRGLDEAQWAAPSRCDGWSVRDVVTHLITADGFWAVSAQGALAGAPTRHLIAFDPVTTPDQLVDGMRALGSDDVLSQYLAAVDALAAILGGLDDVTWSLPAEAPPGRVPLRAMALHALWDGWIHERDILVPLGLGPVEEPDEVAACLGYVAALAPALLATSGSTRTGTLVVEGSDPDTRVVIQAGETVTIGGDAPPGAARLEGRSVDLVEGLSFRAPLPHAVAEDDRWLLGGLARVFDRPPAPAGGTAAPAP